MPAGVTWILTEQLSAAEKESWNHFMQRRGSVFHLSPFIDACAAIGYSPLYASYDDTAKVVCFTKAVGPSFLGLSWTVFFAEPAYAADPPPAERKAMMNALIEQLRARHPASLATIGSMARFRPDSEIPDRAASTPFGTYELDLSPSEETLWSKVHSKHRNAVRAAEKLGVLVQEETNWKTFYELLKSTLARAHEPCPPEKYLTQAAVGLHREESCKLWVASQENRRQAAALILYSKKRAYYWFGATAADAVTGSGNLLHWTIIKELKKAGVETYDFGGARPGLNPESKLYGIQRFKERFGGVYVETPLWTLNCRPAHTAALRLLRSLMTMYNSVRP